LPPSTVVKLEYSESDFVDSDGNRDPFRSYASLFDETKREKKAVNQRNVLLSQYGIDELKLAAIVTGGDYPRAMVIDPAGKGWVLKRGDFLGRSDTVHVGGANGTDYQLNWRVDRVRQGDVVLVREDPAQPNVPPSTRVIALHPEGEAKNQLD
jgi:type IV pilus assembly protein PilP